MKMRLISVLFLKEGYCFEHGSLVLYRNSTFLPQRPASFEVVICGRVVLKDRSLVLIRDGKGREEVFFLDTKDPRAGWFQMPEFNAKGHKTYLFALDLCSVMPCVVNSSLKCQ